MIHTAAGTLPPDGDDDDDDGDSLEQIERTIRIDERTERYPKEKPMGKSLYEQDLVAWSERNAELLRAGRFDEVDIENVAEEIESLGKSDRRQLKSRVTEIIEHKLKLYLLHGIDREPNERGWNLSIKTQRSGIEDLIQESPSLKPRLADPEFLEACYKAGVRDFENSEFGCYAKPPRECPFSWAEILGESNGEA